MSALKSRCRLATSPGYVNVMMRSAEHPDADRVGRMLHGFGLDLPDQFGNWLRTVSPKPSREHREQAQRLRAEEIW